MNSLSIISEPSFSFWVETGNHLWQSTLFGIFILLVITLLWKAPSNTRYMIGWVGLIKFALPSSLIFLAFKKRWPSFLSMTEAFNIESIILPVNTHLSDPLIPFNVTETLIGNSGLLMEAASYSGISFLNILGVIWILGSLLIFSVWQYRLYQFRLDLRSRIQPITGSLNEKIIRLKDKVGIKKQIGCYYADSNIEPSVIGIVSPKLIFPANLVQELSSKELEAVLLHELIHIKRRDNLWRFIQMLFFCAFWFNPLIWWLNQRLTLESEKSCDEEVLKQSKDSRNYAKAIIRVSHFCSGLKLPGLSGMSSARMGSSLKSILSFNGNGFFDGLYYRLIVIAVVFSLILATSASGFLAHLEASSTQEEDRLEKEINATKKISESEIHSNYEYAAAPDEFTTNEQNAYNINLNSSNEGERFITPLNSVKAGNATLYHSDESVDPEMKDLEASQLLTKSETDPFIGKSTVSTLNKIFSPLQVAQTVSDGKNNQLSRMYARSYRKDQIENDKEFYKELEIINQVKPQFPESVLSMGINNGFADVVFIVDERGHSRDFVVAAASHKEFGKSAMEAIKKWRFNPLLVEGKPQTSRVKVEVKFEYDGVSIAKFPNLIDEAIMRSGRDSLLFDSISNLGQLDREPKLINRATPVYPESMKKAERSGFVIVDFFIDPSGNVKAPGIKMATNDEFAIAALAAVKEWKFEPPMKRGKPIYARVKQQFNFSHIPVNF